MFCMLLSHQYYMTNARNTYIAEPRKTRGRRPVKCQGWEDRREIE